ncbi:MAG: (2Fe-2S)-binding protein [Alphaproteobacteria bacterium]
MSGRRAIVLDVNGEEREILVSPGDTLLDALRNGLALTGAKRGCDQGVCGACTVLVDGLAVRACLSLALNCTDRRIVTVEGLGCDGALDPVQQAFVDSGAIQCGFCMPGMVITARALLDETPAPTVEQIRDAIAENLCRCSGYVKIVDAIRMAGRS